MAYISSALTIPNLLLLCSVLCVVCGNNFSRDGCRFLLPFPFFCCRCFPFVVINVSLALFNLNINHGERGRVPLPAGVTGYRCNVQRWVGRRQHDEKLVASFQLEKKQRIIWRSHGACCLHGSTTISALYMLLVPYRIYDVLGSHRKWVYRS